MGFSSETRCPEESYKEFSKLVDIKAEQFSILEDQFFFLDTCLWGRFIKWDCYAVSCMFSEAVGSWNDQGSGKKRKIVKICQQRYRNYALLFINTQLDVSELLPSDPATVLSPDLERAE